MNKAVIQRYFEAYNNKNEAVLDEIIDSEYVDHGQSAYMGALEEIKQILRRRIAEKEKEVTPDLYDLRQVQKALAELEFFSEHHQQRRQVSSD